MLLWLLQTQLRVVIDMMLNCNVGKVAVALAARFEEAVSTSKLRRNGGNIGRLTVAKSRRYCSH